MNWKHVVPTAVRRALRRWQRELPIRVADAPAELADSLRLSSPRLPPPRLRYNVAGSSSREAFLTLGQRASREIWEAAEPFLAPGKESIDVLDFGCGCGRVSARMTELLARSRTVRFAGADIDRAAVDWCRKHLPGDYRVIDNARIPFGDAAFDLVYSVSVFTHMSEEEQWPWLAELRRVLRPSGVLVATTHSPKLVHERPDLPAAQRDELERRGFAFASGYSTFNERSAFHSKEYLATHWRRFFELVDHAEFGLGGYQDLAVFRPASQDR